MKFSLEWLKYFLETEASATEIAAALNRIGIEVEGIEDPADRLAGFRVAEVLTAAPHPDADKLQVLTVNTGEGEPLQVVCGAPNAKPCQTSGSSPLISSTRRLTIPEPSSSIQPCPGASPEPPSTRRPFSSAKPTSTSTEGSVNGK